MSDVPAYQPMPPLPGPSGTTPVPQQVSRAVQALYGLASLQIIGAVSSLLTDDTEATVRANSPELTDSEVSTLVTIGHIFSTIVAVAFAGVWLLCARKILQARSGARVLATALAGLVLFLDTLALVGGAFTDTGDGVVSFIAALGLVCAVGFLVFVWSKPSKAFFMAAAAPR